MRYLALALSFGAMGLALAGDGAGEKQPAKGEKGEKRAKVIGRRIPNFLLTDPATGKEVGLADFAAKKFLIVVFLGTECPIANAYLPILHELREKYADKGVEVVGIHANPGVSREAIAKHAKEFKIAFPVWADAPQSSLGIFGARRVAETFILDARRTVRYHGRIDDRIGYDHRRDEPKRHDLREALDELLAGKKVTQAETEVAGCLITAKALREKTGKVNYADHVAPIFQKHCVECHRPGTAAPFSLLDHDNAANWAAMIREVVSQRRMPPWHADPRWGHFANTRRLTQEEIDTIAAWVDGGAPMGDTKKIASPKEFAKGWTIGKPDVVLQMPEEYTVQAKGTVRYKYFKTPTNFKEDMWIQAAEVKPGNAAVVHHIIVFYRDPKRTILGQDKVWITAFAPGTHPSVFPAGLGRKIPAGAELLWQVHYTPTGKEEKDRSELGLIFCKQPPKHNVVTFGIANPAFRIPPGAANHQVVSSVPVLKDAVVLSLFPHMHLRGKDFEYEAIYPGGKKERLLSVPQYDFNWQHTYRFKEPLSLPKGAQIRCVAHFDNSEANPANPDPKKTVTFGEQTWDEMMIGYIDFYWIEGEKK